MAGTFTINRASIGTVIDTNCQIRSITFVSPVSVAEPVGYQPTWPFLPATGTFCLADAGSATATDGGLAGYRNFNWNFDVLGNGGMLRNVAVPVTPATPHSPKIIARLTCLSCPQGASFTVVTA
jgi:hypothetical protein